MLSSQAISVVSSSLEFDTTLSRKLYHPEHAISGSPGPPAVRFTNETTSTSRRISAAKGCQVSRLDRIGRIKVLPTRPDTRQVRREVYGFACVFVQAPNHKHHTWAGLRRKTELSCNSHRIGSQVQSYMVEHPNSSPWAGTGRWGPLVGMAANCGSVIRIEK